MPCRFGLQYRIVGAQPFRSNWGGSLQMHQFVQRFEFWLAKGWFDLGIVEGKIYCESIPTVSLGLLHRSYFGNFTRGKAL